MRGIENVQAKDFDDNAVSDVDAAFLVELKKI